MTIIQAQPLKTFGIFGPASSADNEVPVFDGTTGKKIKAGSGLINPSAGRIDLSEIRAKDGNGLKLYDDGGSGIFIEDGGNVGIGTTSPDTKLQVMGDVKIGDDNTNYLNVATDGELSLHGTARVKKCFYIDADGIKAPGAKPATFVESGLSGSWEFADAIEANQESISGNVKIPCDADRTIAPVLNIGLYANGISPGVTKFQLEYLYIGENEDMTAGAQETLTATATLSATSNGLTILSSTGMDLPASTDVALLWKIKRLSADGDDTVSAPVFLKGMFFEYYANKLGAST